MGHPRNFKLLDAPWMPGGCPRGICRAYTLEHPQSVQNGAHPQGIHGVSEASRAHLRGICWVLGHPGRIRRASRGCSRRIHGASVATLRSRGASRAHLQGIQTSHSERRCRRKRRLRRRRRWGRKRGGWWSCHDSEKVVNREGMQQFQRKSSQELGKSRSFDEVI